MCRSFKAPVRRCVSCGAKFVGTEKLCPYCAVKQDLVRWALIAMLVIGVLLFLSVWGLPR